MRSGKWQVTVLGCVLMCMAVPAIADADVLWTAYNDCLTQELGFTQPNVTRWTIHNADTGNYTGPLKDFLTGSTRDMPIVTFSMAVGIIPSSIGGGSGGNAAPGTPADQIFGGIIDLGPNILSYTSMGWAQIIEFSNLNPSLTYTFVGTAIRTSNYPTRRTLVTVSGHASATNNSSNGPMIAAKTPHTTVLIAGNNTFAGDVVRWDEISPGADGRFTIRAEAAADAEGGYQAYAINGFMVQATGVLGNRPPQVIVGEDQELTLPMRTLALDATVIDDGLGDPDGYLGYTWSKVSGPGDVVFKPNAHVEDPEIEFPINSPGTYVLRLVATDGELQTAEEVTIIIHPADCPLGDLNGDCLVDTADLYLFALEWLSNPTGGADISGDAYVDFADYNWLAESWQENRQKGGLQVVIYPEEARAAALWRVGGGFWRNSGDPVQGLPVGTYTVEFLPIDDFDAPADREVEVVYGQMAEAEGIYIRHTGSLQVNISPAEVVGEARWRRVGETPWRVSGEQEYNVAVGPCDVEFSSVEGWLPPGLKEAAVEQNSLFILNAIYTERSDITLRINEFMAANHSSTGMHDEHGDYDDWIELFNASDNPIDIAGMYLADDQNIWRIPAGSPSQTTIAPGGYLILWADGQTEQGPLHLAFRLSAEGDQIILYDTDGITVIDSIVFGTQVVGVSYGRHPDAATSWYFFTSPTPAAQNAQAGIAGRVADTKFEPNRGFYDSPVHVSITSKTGGATIYYTTDSTPPIDINGNPTPTAQVYNDLDKVYIATTTCLRAAAVKAGSLPTNIDTHTYIFLEHVLTQANSGTPAGYPSTGWGWNGPDYEVDPDIVNHANANDRLTTLDLRALPTIVVCMPKDDWFKYGQGLYATGALDGTEYPCSFEYIDPNGGLVVQQNCAMAMQGGISGGGTSLNRWKTDKLSMRPRFKTHTDNGTPTGGWSKLSAAIFPDSPVTEYDSFVLDAAINHSWLHSGQHTQPMYVQDQAVADFHNAMGGYSPHGAYAHLYINDLYWGMYYIHERPDHSWAAETFGGNKEEYDAIKHSATGVINDGVGGPGATASYNAMLSAASAAGSNPTDMTRWQTIEEQLDVDNLITYLLANWFPGNHDWPFKNWYATHRVAGRWRYHSWDAEHTFEGTNNIGQSPNDVHGRLKNHIEYKMRWADHIHRHFHNGGALSYPRTNEIYQTRVQQIRNGIRGESGRWGDNRSAIPHTRTEWINYGPQNGSFFTTRSNVVFNWIKGSGLYPNTAPPDFRINGSPMYGGHVSPAAALTLTNPNGLGRIWYTMNGQDPRAPGGAFNAAAIEFTGTPIPLTHSVRVKARVLNGTEWSALSETVFAVGPVAESLRITEIMFNPPAAPAGHPDAEFVELKNVGDTPINLALVRFTKGIHLELPYLQLLPGALAVVVKDRTIFETHYDVGNITVIAVPFTGALDNAGERIELVDALGRTIHNFRYNDNWYLGTDGDGLSLTIRDPYGTDPNAWDRKGAWKASSVFGGTPGQDDNGVGRGDIVINELLAHSHAEAPDWIELRNLTEQSIDLSGMYLSDKDANSVSLMKFRIPDGTIIGPVDTPSSYVVFHEDVHFNNTANPAVIQPFAFSENGEGAYLSQDIGGALTILAEEVFGPSETGVAFGRYIKSTLDGGVNFVAMSVNTPGAPNAYPRVGPVVINEIAYNPLSHGDAEFVELLNISDAPVSFFSYATNEPWRFVDNPGDPGLDFRFPSGPSAITLAAGEYMLLVKDRTAFETVFLGGSNINSLGVQWLEWGVAGGSLSNGGEKLELQMPGDVDGTTRMYIRVDRVAYSDGSHPAGEDPWPTQPDGSDAYTLCRKSSAEYGNDAANWQAAAPTPGATNSNP
ncbi:MAG: lamin tail domain-containing protein [Phycisphaerae bacterium]|nr:lamin tail domain-containing protein [Phycisphaerae bacterium]